MRHDPATFRLPAVCHAPVGRQLCHAVLFGVPALALPSVYFPSLDAIPQFLNAQPPIVSGCQSQVLLEDDKALAINAH